MRATALPDLLFGRSRAALLGLFYGHPDRSFYYREITRRLSTLSPGTLQRELATLAAAELVERTTSANQVFYQANRNHPVFGELRSLVAKTVGYHALLREALTPIEKLIALAFVYGSTARGEETASSDVDLMVVGDVSLEEVLERLTETEATLGRAVNPTVYSVAEFRAKLASGNHFLKAVLGGAKVFVVGDENELGELRAKQLDRRRTHKR